VEGGPLRRIAENQAIFRDANERIEESVDALELTGETPFLCECGDERCSAALMLRRDEYESVRAHATRFVIVPGHETPEGEEVVERNDRYWVVEKTGVGREVAQEADGRS
jgi:hypothetical protein